MADDAQLDIDYVARLARLTLSAEEKAEYARQLRDVLRHIEQLSKVDVTGVESTAHAFPIENVWSEDVPRAGFSVAEALRNAPAQRDDMISVPKIVE